MNVLILFEESQAVCKSFRAAGHNAYSCDLKPCSGGHPEWHIQNDIFNAMYLDKWDFIGMHPVCTKMTLSGNRTYAKGKPKHKERIESVEWTIKLWQEVCKIATFVYMENPMGAMNGDKRLPRPQIIQPYYFGDSFQKTTCLWLQNLPPLYHNDKANLFDSNITHVDRGEMFIAKSGKVLPKWYADSSTSGNNEKNRAIRSKTFPGIANAMAAQWGNLLNQNNTP